MDFPRAVLIIYQLIFTLPSIPTGDPQQVCSTLPFWQFWLGMDDCLLHAKDRCELCFSELQRKWTSLFSSADHFCFLCSFLQLNFSLKNTFSLTERMGNRAGGRNDSSKDLHHWRVLLPPTPVPKSPGLASLQCKRVTSTSSLASGSVFDWTDGSFAPQRHQLWTAWHCAAGT